MKKIIKWLLVILLIFPLWSCKDNQLNEFGITYKLEEELKRAYYEQGEYTEYIKEYNIPYDAVELAFYYGEYDGFHVFLCFLAPYSFECITGYWPYHWSCEPCYVYKNKKLYKMDYAIKNNIIDEDAVKYEGSVEDQLEYINSIRSKVGNDYTISYYYCAYLGIDTKTDKRPLYKYSFDFIKIYSNNHDFRLYVALLREKDKVYLPIGKKETIADISFYYYDSAKIELYGTIFTYDEQGKMKSEITYLSLQEAYDLGYITKENLQEIKDIAIEKGYIKDK
ncbi:MAG: hypothetical protein IJV94_02120 [Bacilli bacterium]|nr:hypothetical protein [Bacilli bacterium]